MKTLIVFYSRTNTTKKVALRLAEKLEATVEELIDKKNRKGVIGYIVGGKDAMKKTLADIDNIKEDASQYDLVVLATPVWVGTMSPAIRTYITDNKSKFKKVAFLTTQGGDKSQRVFEDMKNLSGKNPVAEEKLTTKDVRADEYEDSLDVLIKKLENQL